MSVGKEVSNMTKSAIFASVLLLLAPPAFAQTETSNSRSKTFAKQRCMTHTEIGTRLAKKRTCMSEAEWREMQQRTNFEVSQVQGRKPCTHELC
jgi:hypothetical protein